MRMLWIAILFGSFSAPVLAQGNEVNWYDDAFERYPDGYVLVVKKDQRSMALGLDGVLVQGLSLRKSELDERLFGDLANSEADEVELSFPVPVAVSDRLGTRTYRYDRKTPEGDYRICNHSDRGHTNHTVALSINFPNESDLKLALDKGRISRDEYRQQMRRLSRGLCPTPDTYLGGWIRIHGPSDEQVKEWSNAGVTSCSKDMPEKKECEELSFEEYLASDNAEIGVVVPGRYSKGCMVLELTPLFYLYKTLPTGTPVVILP